MYDQIKSTKKYIKWSRPKQKDFGQIEKRIKSMKNKYQKRLRTLADKYILHNEYRTPAQIRKEKETLEIGWKHIEKLITEARELINIMYDLWCGKQLSFESGHYKYFSEGFWESIKPIKLKQFR